MGKCCKVFSMAAIAMVPTVCKCSADAAQDHVAAMAATNHLETWEGRYSYACTIPLGEVGGGDVLYGCLYRCDGRNDATLWRQGTLLEAYVVSTGHVSRILDADVNVKGVTPVLLEIAIPTNSPAFSYVFMWRYPGNGGFMRCMEYVYTNQTLHPVGHWEYIGGRNDKRWHWAVDDNTLVPTNFAWQPRETIWKDENTLYRLDRYP